MRWLALLLSSGCGLVLDVGPPAIDAAGAADASLDARAGDASPPDAGTRDSARMRDTAPGDAIPAPDAGPACPTDMVLLAEDFEGDDRLDARGWASMVETPPLTVRLSEPAGDGPGSDGGRYLVFETNDGSTGTAESGSASSPWVALPDCGGGALHVAVHAVAGDIDFARDGERFELIAETREGDLLGSISFSDQDNRDIGRPGALLGGHRLLERTDWIPYTQTWAVPPTATEVRVSIYIWVTHWDDFGGIDEVLLSFNPAR